MLQQEEEACSMPHGLQIVDFSKLNLSNMSADELEQLYIQTHCNNHIVTCPHTLQVTVKQISLARMPSAPTLLKLRFRNEKATTKPTQTLLHHHDRTFQFKVSYHALLFDTLKVRTSVAYRSALLGVGRGGGQQIFMWVVGWWGFAAVWQIPTHSGRWSTQSMVG